MSDHDDQPMAWAGYFHEFDGILFTYYNERMHKDHVSSSIRELMISVAALEPAMTELLVKGRDENTYASSEGVVAIHTLATSLFKMQEVIAGKAAEISVEGVSGIERHYIDAAQRVTGSVAKASGEMIQKLENAFPQFLPPSGPQ